MLGVQINPPALRVIRERSGMTISQLAVASGVDRSHLTNIEAGRAKASPKTIEAIRKALKVELPAILVDPAPESVTS